MNDLVRITCSPWITKSFSVEMINNQMTFVYWLTNLVCFTVNLFEEIVDRNKFPTNTSAYTQKEHIKTHTCDSIYKQIQLAASTLITQHQQEPCVHFAWFSFFHYLCKLWTQLQIAINDIQACLWVQLSFFFDQSPNSFNRLILLNQPLSSWMTHFNQLVLECMIDTKTHMWNISLAFFLAFALGHSILLSLSVIPSCFRSRSFHLTLAPDNYISFSPSLIQSHSHSLAFFHPIERLCTAPSRQWTESNMQFCQHTNYWPVDWGAHNTSDSKSIFIVKKHVLFIIKLWMNQNY